MEERIFKEEQLVTFCQKLFEANKVPEEEARFIAQHIVHAEMDGVSSHGVNRMSIYTKRLETGVVNPVYSHTVESTSPSCERWNAENSMGIYASYKAMKRAIEMAGESGTGIVVVNNSNHPCQIGQYVKQAADVGMLGFSCANGGALIAPWGGCEPYFGTNPLAVGVPTHGGSVILDMATSVAAFGKVMVASKLGKLIPEGWALDKDGNDTTDPNEALQGTALPFGGVKGYGIALFVDILSGVLSGSAFGNHVNNYANDYDHPQNVGHMLMAIDISKIMDLEAFKDRMGVMIEDIKTSRKRPSVEEIYLPGEIEQLRHQKSEAEGIRLAIKTVDELNGLALKYGTGLQL